MLQLNDTLEFGDLGVYTNLQFYNFLQLRWHARLNSPICFFRLSYPHLLDMKRNKSQTKIGTFGTLSVRDYDG